MPSGTSLGSEGLLARQHRATAAESSSVASGAELFFARNDADFLAVLSLGRGRFFERQRALDKQTQARRIPFDHAPPRPGAFGIGEAGVPAILLIRQSELLVNGSADILAPDYDHLR